MGALIEGLGVVGRTLSALLNGHAGVSPDMAIRCPRRLGICPKASCNCNCNMICGRPRSDPGDQNKAISDASTLLMVSAD
jgi:hypothetical protein